MKSQELKKALKPLIKECVKEMMIEEGFLSSVVSEVIKGMNANVIVERAAPAKPNQREEEWHATLEVKMEAERQQRIKKLNESMKSQHNIDVFDGVDALPVDVSDVNSSPEATGALSGVSPNDPGVDINAIMKVGGGPQKWKTLARGGSNV